MGEILPGPQSLSRATAPNPTHFGLVRIPLTSSGFPPLCMIGPKLSPDQEKFISGVHLNDQ